MYAQGKVKPDKIVEALSKGHKLNPKYKDKPINRGVWKNKGFRDCHVITVSNDWVLIYDKDKNFLTLVATGSHAKLFPKF